MPDTVAPGTTKRPVSPPTRKLPPGAWDAHAHVVGPFDRFPLHPGRRLTPPLAPCEDYLEMLDTVGFAHGVLVHSQVNGLDNATTLDAVARGKGRLRGIGVVAADTGEQGLAELGVRGLCGLRFSDDGSKPAGGSWFGTLTLDDLEPMAPRLQAVGWHAQVHAKCEFIVARAARLRACGIPIVFDHTGRPDTALGAGHATFQSFLKLLRDGPFFVKLTPGRVSERFPDYPDVRPFHDALLNAVPDQLFFGSDWPFYGEYLPDAGRMVDLFDAWTGDDDLRQRIFVTNPRRLFGV